MLQLRGFLRLDKVEQRQKGFLKDLNAMSELKPRKTSIQISVYSA